MIIFIVISILISALLLTFGILFRKKENKDKNIKKSYSARKIHRWYYTITQNWSIIFFIASATILISTVVVIIKGF